MEFKGFKPRHGKTHGVAAVDSTRSFLSRPGANYYWKARDMLFVFVLLVAITSASDTARFILSLILILNDRSVHENIILDTTCSY